MNLQQIPLLHKLHDIKKGDDMKKSIAELEIIQKESVIHAKIVHQ